MWPGTSKHVAQGGRWPHALSLHRKEGLWRGRGGKRKKGGLASIHWGHWGQSRSSVQAREDVYSDWSSDCPENPK